MCRKASCRFLAVAAAGFATAWFAATIPAYAQTSLAAWRHLGTAAIDLGLASLATGPVDRVWYSGDGGTLFARTHSGVIYQTDDFERWSPVSAIAPPPAQNLQGAPLPEASARVRSAGTHLYGLAHAAWRSADGGVPWSNLTQIGAQSLTGSAFSDFAVSPRDPDELVIASAQGVWRSLDAGASWTGVNQFLPNLSARRLYSLPDGLHGVRIGLSGAGTPELEWLPGEKTAWQPTDNSELVRDETTKATLSRQLNAAITAAAVSGNWIYAGSVEGQLWSSSDNGATWNGPSDRAGAPVESIYVSARDARIAIGALGTRSAAVPPQSKVPHILRTMNGGIFWDDISANLPETAAHGVTADPSSGAVYAATDAGVFLTSVDLGAAGRPTSWTLISAELPTAAATDVKLDPAGNQLFVALDGQGIYTTIAPHRVRDIRMANAADLSLRPAAPGGILSVVGAHVQAVQTSESASIPVVAASDSSSQIQVPFDAKGSQLTLSVQVPSGSVQLGFPLLNVSPAIFVDPDGTPIVLDSESGVLLDAAKPAHPQSRLQILATGLGRVNPDWPSGVAAPVTDPPQVIAAVHAYLNGLPLTVSRATLAPNYIGSYLVEVEIPSVLNQGPADLYIEADGQSSNHVRIYLK